MPHKASEYHFTYEQKIDIKGIIKKMTICNRKEEYHNDIKYIIF